MDEAAVATEIINGTRGQPSTKRVRRAFVLGLILSERVDSPGFHPPDCLYGLVTAQRFSFSFSGVSKDSLSTKLRIYTSLVQSVVLYGSDTWTMRKVDSDRIQSFHMHCVVLVSDGMTRYPTE